MEILKFQYFKIPKTFRTSLHKTPFPKKKNLLIKYLDKNFEKFFEKFSFLKNYKLSKFILTNVCKQLFSKTIKSQPYPNFQKFQLS